MKNILLGTSALIGAAVFATGALAEDPKVMIGGVIDVQGAHVSEDLDTNNRSVALRNDTEINVSVAGKSENGLGYGAVIDLEADVTADADTQGVNAARTYVYLDGNFGRTEFGSVEGAGTTMQVTAANIARATGGINGDWTYFPNAAVTGGAATGNAVISTAALPVAHGTTGNFVGDEISINASKINYYTPRFNGFQLGASWTPATDNRGQVTARVDNNAGFENVIDLGLTYEGELSGVSVAAAFTGERGSAEVAGIEDLRAWNLGATLGYHGLSLAASYADWGDSGMATGTNVDQDFYTLGAAYDFGPFGASITYLDSQIESGTVENDFDNLVIGADYKLAPGLTPYVEAAFFDADIAGTTTGDNEGTVVLVGTNLSF